MLYHKYLSALLILAVLLSGCAEKDRRKHDDRSSIAQAWHGESHGESEPLPITSPQPSLPEESGLFDQPPQSSSILMPEKRESPASPTPSPETLPDAGESTPTSRSEPAIDSRAGGGSGTVIWPSPRPDPPKTPETVETVEGIDVQQFETELIRLINDEREQHGKRALSWEDSMGWAARIRAAEVLVNLSHTRPDGTSYYTAFDEAGFAYAGKWHGENISYMEYSGTSYDTASAARYMFDELRSSPGHYTNMLNENFAQIGVGVEVEAINGRVKIGSAQMFAGL